ncbi:MAG: lycopene cyclase domain-containing protein [Micrococcales bacterium]|nr:lycopene cyclase domain-containing protein [Micrococcales bacterium]
MTYTALAVVGVLTVVSLDRWVARTRLTSLKTWWVAYGIIFFFQLLTNGWLTGRRIVRYNPDMIIGNDRVTVLGQGRIVFAPIEDLAFGFALVLLSCVVWVWLGRRSGDEQT